MPGFSHDSVSSTDPLPLFWASFQAKETAQRSALEARSRAEEETKRRRLVQGVIPSLRELYSTRAPPSPRHSSSQFYSLMTRMMVKATDWPEWAENVPDARLGMICENQQQTAVPGLPGSSLTTGWYLRVVSETRHENGGQTYHRRKGNTGTSTQVYAQGRKRPSRLQLAAQQRHA